MSSLVGKRALVTGSSSGIGFAIGTALAQAGVHTVFHGRINIEEFKGRLALEGVQPSEHIHYCNADLSTIEGCGRLADGARNALGQIDILVNNAGVQFVSPIGEFPIEKWEEIISTNLTSAFFLSKAFVPTMQKQGWGRIVNIASAHGLVASPYKSAYVAAKHGLVGLTKTVSLETAETRVTCNAICPGYIDTPLVRKQVDEQAAADNLSSDDVIENVILAAQPNKRFAKPSDIAELVLFLCSSSADGITGAALSVDGGWTAQ